MIRKKTSPPSNFTQSTTQVSPQLNMGENLVGIGFRSWMSGYQTRNFTCWQEGWNVFARELGVEQAKLSITDLACWVRSIHAGATRNIEIYPASCEGFCRDESMAISMVAACQNNACPAMKACAFALIGDAAINEVVDTAERFADTLGHCGVVLGAESITNAVPVGSAEPMAVN